MALDEASAALVAQAAGTRRVYELPVAETRRIRHAAAAAVRRQPVAQVSDALVGVAGGSVPVRVLTPPGRPRAVIVFYHGGGWVLGGLDECEPVCRALVNLTGCAVVSAGYRLAPEYRYPTAVEDAWAALLWAAARAGDIAAEPVPLIVAGESAGGNLAAVLARRSAERGGPPLALQVLVYPVTDSDLDAQSYTDPANQLMLNREAMSWFWDQYAPDPAARTHPDASPLQAVFLSGVAPAVVVTAEHDVLRDEGELYAMRLVQAGVAVEHRRFGGQLHGFLGQIDVLPGSRQGLEYIAAAIARRLRAAGGSAGGLERVAVDEAAIDDELGAGDEAGVG
jgi:acetyl esterase